MLFVNGRYRYREIKIQTNLETVDRLIYHNIVTFIDIQTQSYDCTAYTNDTYITFTLHDMTFTSILSINDNKGQILND